MLVQDCMIFIMEEIRMWEIQKKETYDIWTSKVCILKSNYSAPRLGDAMIFGENRENKISVLPLDFCKSG